MAPNSVAQTTPVTIALPTRIEDENSQASNAACNPYAHPCRTTSGTPTPEPAGNATRLPVIRKIAYRMLASNLVVDMPFKEIMDDFDWRYKGWMDFLREKAAKAAEERGDFHAEAAAEGKSVEKIAAAPCLCPPTRAFSIELLNFEDLGWRPRKR